MTKKKIITTTIIVILCHFVITSLIGRHIAVQVGTQMGKIVAEGLLGASEKKTDNAEEEAKRIDQEMKAKSAAIKDEWKIPELIISLPAKPLMTPLLKELRQNQMNKVINKEMSRDQFRKQVYIIHYTTSFLNSLSFGLLVYIALKIINQKIQRAPLDRE